MNKLFLIILGIALPITIFLATVEMVSFDEKYFEKTYIENDVVSDTKLGKDELMKVTNELLAYLKGKNNKSYLQKYFNENEILHLEDVRYLFKVGFLIKNVSLFLLLSSIIYLIYRDPIKISKITKSVNKSALISFIVLGICLTLSLIDFNKNFTYFHLILFDNDLWLLDPNTDLMIQMMPETFFISAFREIVLLFFAFMSTIVMAVNIFKVRLNGKNGNRFINKG